MTILNETICVAMVTVINQPIHVFMIIDNAIMLVANFTVYYEKKQQYSYGGCIK